jgi:hypothetical protein
MGMRAAGWWDVHLEKVYMHSAKTYHVLEDFNGQPLADV